MKIKHFFEPCTSTLTYLVYDAVERLGVLIDPVRDFDAASAHTSTESADTIAAFLEAEGIELPYVLDTHVHADHLSALPYFRDRFGAKTVIGANVTVVQRYFRDFYGLGCDFPVDGRQFDVLLRGGEALDLGPFEVQAIETPGHTPACTSYRIGDALFVGDTLFMPDYGTARCDFPGASAEILFDSIYRLYQLCDRTRVFTCHDYRPGGRELRFESTIWEERSANVQLNAFTRQEDYVRLRKERDASLSTPALMLPAIQANIRGGELPEPDADGMRYLRIPLNSF